MKCKPVVIIGAPRSGTNILRDLLTSASRTATWPCDEINYIWRHGNVRFPCDEFHPDMATPGITGYVRSWFSWVAARYDAQVVVEKTCANSLRAGFVDRIVPEAAYVLIRRNGVDAAASAARRWKAPLDLAYSMRKARFVPKTDILYYFAGYVRNRMHKIRSKEKRLAYWGPRFKDMDALVKTHPIEEICALQWKRCVDLSDEWLERKESRNCHEVRYEDLVEAPVREMRRLGEHLGLDWDESVLEQAAETVSTGSVGKGARTLDERSRNRILELAGDTMKRHGYS